MLSKEISGNCDNVALLHAQHTAASKPRICPREAECRQEISVNAVQMCRCSKHARGKQKHAGNCNQELC